MATAKQNVFNLGLRLTALLARSPLHRLTSLWVRGLAAMTLRIQRGRKREELPAIAREWQRMFPSRKMVPIVEEGEDTVVAEIHGHCPLRGTGDHHACYRMMEYDRHLMKTIGGNLTVLHSQSEPGRTHCVVALRRAGSSLGPAQE